MVGRRPPDYRAPRPRRSSSRLGCYPPLAFETPAPSLKQAVFRNSPAQRPHFIPRHLTAPILPNRHFPGRRTMIYESWHFSKRPLGVCVSGFAESFGAGWALSRSSTGRSPALDSCSCTALSLGLSCMMSRTFRCLRRPRSPTTSDRVGFGPARFKGASGVFYSLLKGS